MAGCHKKYSKITIPQPFQMTVREATKSTSNRPRCAPAGGAKGNLDEEMECLKKFRANVVPAHTFLPLYDQMVRTDAIRRQAKQQRHREEPVALRLPFSIVNRTERRRSRSVADMDSATDSSGAPSATRNRLPNTGSFKSYAEFKAEDDLLRELRIKSRAERLLKESALPPSIKESQDRQQLKKQLLKAKLVSEIQPTTPIRAVHRPASALPKPVEMDSASDKPYSSTGARMKVSRQEVVVRPPMTRRRSRSVSDLRDAAGFTCHPRINEGTRMRNEATRKRYWGLDSPKTREPANDVWGIKEAVTRCAKQHPSKSLTSKVLNLRKETQIRNKEYSEELRKMMSRIKEQPLLIDRQSQMSAKNKVERKFKQSLAKHGLDMEFVMANSEKAKTEQVEIHSESSDDEGGDEENSTDDSFEDVGSEAESDGQEESENVSSADERSTGASDEELEKIPERDFS